MTAIANNSKRVDFITQLPSDIVITHIIPRMAPAYLQSNVLYEPLDVSRGWQERILQQPKGLRFNLDHEFSTFQTGHAQLIRFAPYVQTFNGSLLGVRLDDLFFRAHFPIYKSSY